MLRWIVVVSLTMRLSIILANEQLDAQILIHLLRFSTCTCFEQYLAHHQEVKLYEYSSGIVTLSNWPPGAQVEKELFFNLCTGRSLTESKDTRCCINTIWSRDDEQDIARNMYI
jgi:hypothetical protein